MATVKKTTKKVARKKASVKAPATNTTIKEGEENVFAKITKVVTQICIGVVAIVVVFSPDSTWVLGPIIGSLAIMGISLGYFASK